MKITKTVVAATTESSSLLEQIVDVCSDLDGIDQIYPCKIDGLSDIAFVFRYVDNGDDMNGRLSELTMTLRQAGYSNSELNVSDDAIILSVTPIQYYKQLADKACKILITQFGVDATATEESFGIRFEVYVPGTYDLLAEEVYLYEDIVADPADIDDDANTIAEHLAELASAANADSDEEYEDDYDEEDIY